MRAILCRLVALELAVERGDSDTRDLPLHALARVLQKGPRKREDVIAPLAQRRHPKVYDAKSVIEILPKPRGVDFGRQVARPS